MSNCEISINSRVDEDDGLPRCDTCIIWYFKNMTETYVNHLTISMIKQKRIRVFLLAISKLVDKTQNTLSIHHFITGDQYLLYWYSGGLCYMFDPFIMKTVKPNWFRFLFCPIFILLINRPWLPQQDDSLFFKRTSILQAISWRHISMA